MIKKIILASNNAHKIEEFVSMFKDFNVEVISLNEAGIACDPIEDGITFLENALIKAKEIANFTNLPIISDDSGLEVSGLGGFPGVYSARFMEGSPYEEKRLEIVNRLENVSDKSADFKTVLCLFNVEEEPLFFEGQVDGHIVYPRGDSGFAYDPIFYCDELNKTFGEATSNEKNSVSHRSRALNKLINYLLKTEKIKK